jgi:hypothetical protein
VNATVVLEEGDSFAFTAQQAAEQVLAALGGNPANDFAYVSLQTNQQGIAGTPASPETE